MGQRRRLPHVEKSLAAMQRTGGAFSNVLLLLAMFPARSQAFTLHGTAGSSASAMTSGVSRFSGGGNLGSSRASNSRKGSGFRTCNVEGGRGGLEELARRRAARGRKAGTGAGLVLMMANPENFNIKDQDLEFMFWDESTVFVKGGTGGNGASTYKVGTNFQRGAPDGGSGGRGGDVWMECDGGLNTLSGLRGSSSYHAKTGLPGTSWYCNGKDGLSASIKVPPGTVVKERETGRVIGELKREGDRLRVARGGDGGRGNAAQKYTRGIAPKASSAEAGEKMWLQLELRLVADIGLVGVPSAGKSSLLAKASNAKPKIADYPFTTLIPNLGVCDPGENGFLGQGMVLADIPGMLEGAHRGVGLGRAFLRHVERCRVIIHVISGSSPDPIGDFKAINQELALFSPSLGEKPQVVVLNKIDLPEVAPRQQELLEGLRAEMDHTRLLSISALDGDNVSELMRRSRQFLDKVIRDEAQKARRLAALRADKQRAAMEEDPDANVDDLINASRVSAAGEGMWLLSDARVEQMVQTIDWDYYGSEARFMVLLESLGLVEELQQAGAEDGELLLVGDMQIAYKDPGGAASSSRGGEVGSRAALL